MKTSIKIFIALALFVFACSNVFTQKIDGWFKAGSKPDSYEWGKAEDKYNDKAVYFLKSKEKSIEGFGTVMTYIMPDEYLGKRLRLSGNIKNEKISGWAGMWMRVDGTDPNKSLAFDNMFDRAIGGSSAWTKYEIVLDVSKEAIGIAYGVLMNGTGQIWISDLKFEVVGNDVPTTEVK